MTSHLQLPIDDIGPSPDDVSAVIASVKLFSPLAAEARSALASAAEPLSIAAGERLFPEGCGADALYILRDGLLHALEPDPPRDPRLVRVIRAGEIVDGLQELGAGKNPVGVFAVGPSSLFAIPGHAMDELVDAHADISAARDRLHHRQLLCRLHRLFGSLDETLLADLEAEADWIHLQRGEVLFDVGAPSDGLYFVISGRVAALRVLDDGREELSADRGRGEILGEVGFFTATPRAYRARALRDSVVVAYTAAEFERLIARHPDVVRHITAAVAERAASAAVSGAQASATMVSTIVVVGATPRAPVKEFAERLSNDLSRFGAVMRLDSRRVEELMTEPGIAQAAEDTPDEERLLAWLDRCETRHRFVICESDPAQSEWSRRCARRADRLVLVADARDPHNPGDLERAMMAVASGAAGVRAMLVLVHPDASQAPTGTSRWLDARPAVNEHYHVRWNESGDMQRIARVLAGRAVGLVLGGGGARGFAHIGILRAFSEAGIPIDAIGGTSMGSSIAGQYAVGKTPDQITATSRKVFLEVKPHRAFTLPILALVNTRRTVEAAKMFYGDVEIEDLWMPFFCVSSNLTTAQVMVHRRGPLWQAAVASSSLPGIGVPVLYDRQLLVDGGLLNNLPTDEMRRLGCGTVIASAVSSEETEAFTCERVPTSWEVLRARFLRKAGVPRFPSLFNVIMRSSLLHSVHSERVNVEQADLSLRPPVEAFGLLEFERIDDIVAVGYADAGTTIARWREEAVPIFS